jgi:hypothetical protein
VNDDGYIETLVDRTIFDVIQNYVENCENKEKKMENKEKNQELIDFITGKEE